MLTPEELLLVGMSDLSAIVGLNPYRSAHAVYSRIVLGRFEPETKVMRRGTLMEPVIRAMSRDEYGLTLLGPRSLRPRPWMRASLDDVIQAGSEEVAEFKSVSPFAAGDYGEEETDEVPQHHILQCQGYMAATGMRRAHLFALIGIDDLRHYIIRADGDLQGMLFKAAERFYEENILKKVPPPIDASKSCSEYLAERYPSNRGNFVKATPDAERWAMQLHAARVAMEVAEEKEKEARNHLVNVIADADGIQGDGWKVAHTLVKGRSKTDWQAVATEAGATVGLTQKHTTIGGGYRRFLPNFSGMEKKS